MASDDPRRPSGGGPQPFPFPPMVQQMSIAPVGVWSAVFGGFFLLLGVGWTLANLGYIEFDALAYLPLVLAILGALILWSSYRRRQMMRKWWESQLPPR